MEIAVMTKPAGQADPGPLYTSLGAYILKQGYVAYEGPCEKLLSHAKKGNYSQMSSESMIPIKKNSGSD